jgi:hypothetical protein
MAWSGSTGEEAFGVSSSIGEWIEFGWHTKLHRRKKGMEKGDGKGFSLKENGRG